MAESMEMPTFDTAPLYISIIYDVYATFKPKYSV